MTLPSPTELQKAWEDLKVIHSKHLQVHGVKLPDTKIYNKLQKAMWLSMLYLNKHRAVDKNEISELAARDMPKLAADQQVRHLKRDGWTLVQPKRGFHQLDPYQPSPEFVKTSAQKSARLKAQNFEELVEKFGRICTTCGAMEGQPDPRYGSSMVKLQQGHRDPAKPGNVVSNIIPQCQFCNQAYKNDFAFDDKGRVSTIASVEPVSRASKEIRKAVWILLKEEFGE